MKTKSIQTRIYKEMNCPCTLVHLPTFYLQLQLNAKEWGFSCSLTQSENPSKLHLDSSVAFFNVIFVVNLNIHSLLSSCLICAQTINKYQWRLLLSLLHMYRVCQGLWPPYLVMSCWFWTRNKCCSHHRVVKINQKCVSLWRVTHNLWRT